MTVMTGFSIIVRTRNVIRSAEGPQRPRAPQTMFRIPNTVTDVGRFASISFTPFHRTAEKQGSLFRPHPMAPPIADTYFMKNVKMK